VAKPLKLDEVPYNLLCTNFTVLEGLKIRYQALVLMMVNLQELLAVMFAVH
jgi:hypothetical protein